MSYGTGTGLNLLDAGGGVNRNRVTAAFKIILSDPKVCVPVNIFGRAERHTIIANGIVAAAPKVVERTIAGASEACQTPNWAKKSRTRPRRLLQ